MRLSSRLGPVALLALVVASMLATSAATPSLALAGPTLAVAPLDGDKDGTVSDVVAEAAAEHGKTTKPDRVARELQKLDISSFTSKALKKLRTKLSVDVVIHGKVTPSGAHKHLELIFSGAGKAKGSLELDYRSTKDLRKALSARLGHQIDAASGGADSADEEDAGGHSDSPLRGHGGDSSSKDDERKSKDDERGSEDEERSAFKHSSKDEDRGSKNDHKTKDDDRAAKDDERGSKNGRKSKDDDRASKDDERGSDDEHSAFKHGDGHSSKDDDRSSKDDRKSKDDDRGSKDERKSKHEDDRKSKDDDDRRTSKRDDDRKSKDDDRKSKRDDDRRHKRASSRDDEESGSSDEEVSDEGEEASGRRHKKRRHRGSRHPLTQAAVWFDAGASFARRTLTYDASGMMRPPPVGTVAPAVAIEGELYPASFSTLKGAAAGFGIAGAYERALGLGIAVPGTTIVAPIKSGNYWIGARYRFVFGGSSLAIGASYWRQYYMADRSKLMMPGQLDMPDVDYTALAPDVTARIGATPKISVFGAVQVPLMFSSGPIQKATSYGPSKIIAFDIQTGVQVSIGAHYAIQVALGFDQIGLKFNAKMGSQAALRQVSAATDRSLGLAVTLGINY